MGCGASLELSPGLGLVQNIEQRAASGKAALHEPVPPTKPTRSALVGYTVPAQSGGAAGVVQLGGARSSLAAAAEGAEGGTTAAAAAAGAAAVADGGADGDDDAGRVEWQSLSRSGWGHSLARALAAQHGGSQLQEGGDGGAVVEPRGTHPLAQAEALAHLDAGADHLFWGTTRVSSLPLTWRMAVAAVHRLRALCGQPTGHAVYDNELSASCLQRAQKYCVAHEFEVDSQVTLLGLRKKSARHNGSDARVVGFDRRRLQYKVELAGGTALTVRAENLRAVLTAAADIAGGDEQRQIATDAEEGVVLTPAVHGGRSPLDVLESLLADPLGRRALPLWSHAGAFGLGYAVSTHLPGAVSHLRAFLACIGSPCLRRCVHGASIGRDCSLLRAVCAAAAPGWHRSAGASPPSTSSVCMLPPGRRHHGHAWCSAGR
jgi:hypothetical protein